MVGVVKNTSLGHQQLGLSQFGPTVANNLNRNPESAFYKIYFINFTN